MNLGKLVIYVGAGYTIYCAGLFFFQRHLIFPSMQIPVPEKAPEEPWIEKSWIPISGGRVESWYLHVEASEIPPPYPLLIYAHGNGELIDMWPHVFRSLTKKGIGVLLVEYPGYGRSQGKPSQRTITEALVATYDRIRRHPEVDPERIILFGRSIGGGAACALARERPSAALVLMSTFTSLRVFARHYLAPSFLLRSPFDNLAVVSRYSGPILLVHGEKDTVVPLQHSVALKESAPRARLITYPGSGHNDCPPDWEDFFDRLMDFLQDEGIQTPAT